MSRQSTFCVIVLLRLIRGKPMGKCEIRWRPPSVLFVPVIICGGLIFFVDIIQLNSFNIPTRSLVPRPRFVGYSEDYNLKGFLIKTNGCRIPQMDPLDPSIAKYIFKEQQIFCNNNTPPLVESNLTHLYVLRTSLSAYGLSNISALRCCYSEFRRRKPKGREWDNMIKFNKKCVEFKETSKITDEFVGVICLSNHSVIYRDFFAFVPVQSKLLKKLPKNRDNRLNVLVIGIDAVSRLNFHRQMPKTVEMLKELNTVEMLGFNKVGDNTFPNLVPVLTGLNLEELKKTCWPSKDKRFDKCPFLWKNFSAEGYITAFGEDSSWMGMFNYLKHGFGEQPTDYFWGPFNYISERQIGNAHKLNVFRCVGTKMVYKSLLEYIDKFVISMRRDNASYFGFFWGTSISHDFLNSPQLADNDYAIFLNKIRDNGVLNNTVLIVMSDHGIRWGGIRTTYQGRMEERLPFLFVYLPEDYRNDFYHTYINLRRNAKRLTTPFDLHQTLKDLIKPYSLTQESLNMRIEERRNGSRGYSLFEPIPTQRTCDDAGIESHWCTCQHSSPVDVNDTIVGAAANFTVDYINNQLQGYSECATLDLAEIYNARRQFHNSQVIVGQQYTQDYTITLRTIPGDALFDVTVRQYYNKITKLYYFNITGTISRINLYGRQSLCMTDFHLKLYCYCKT